MKLVRDKIPTLFPEAGIYYRAPSGLLDRLLMAKVVEEVAEVFGADTAEEVAEEIADVIEVLYALALGVNVGERDIDAARAIKRASRGGFEGGWVLG